MGFSTGQRAIAARTVQYARQSAEVISKILNQTAQLPGNRRGTVRRSTVVDIDLDVGVNVGQGTSTCSQPGRKQKNTSRIGSSFTRATFDKLSEASLATLDRFFFSFIDLEFSRSSLSKP